MRASIFDGINHSLNAALAESAGDQHAVGVLQSQRRSLARIEFLGFHPFDDRAVFMREAPVDQRFAQTFVSVFQLHVFAHHRDAHFAFRLAHALEQLKPRAHIAFPACRCSCWRI